MRVISTPSDSWSSSWFGCLSSERCQHPAQIETPRLDQVRSGLRVHEVQLLAAQLGQFPAKAFRIRHDALRGLLEGNEDAPLVALRTMDQEAQREDGLGRARSVHEQRGPPARQASPGNFVEADDAGRRFVSRALGIGRRKGFHAVSCGRVCESRCW
jgi:hypothetical protein